jgi:cytochrome c556
MPPAAAAGGTPTLRFPETMMQKAVKLGLGVALATVFATAAFAQAQPDRAIKYRQGIMQAQSWNLGILAAMVKGEQPYNKDKFLYHAIALEQVSRMAWEGYIPGSDQGAPTRAKPEIWKDAAKFQQARDAFESATPKLVAAAKVGTLDAVKAPFNDVAKTCDSCHDDFRSK